MSAIMFLHTVYFNPQAKGMSMSRATFIETISKSVQVPPLVLEYVYDNVTCTPFVHKNSTQDVLHGTSISSKTSIAPRLPRKLGKTNDPYVLLACQDDYSSFCQDIKRRCPLDSPIHFGIDYE